MKNEISAKELYRLVHQRPFQPFRIHIGNERSLDIRFGDMNMVLRDTIVVGIPPKNDDPDPIADYAEWIHIPSISKIEMLPPVSAGALN